MKRWEYQIIWPAAWKTSMQVKKQQLDSDMEQQRIENWKRSTTKLCTVTLLISLLCRVQISSVSQSCLTLCDPMNCSTPGLPIHHQLLEFTQTHLHRVRDAIQPSHPLPSPSPPAPNPSQHQSFPVSQLFTWGGQSTGVSPLASFLPKKARTDLLQNGLVGSPCSPRDSQESSPTPQFKSIHSSMLIFLYSPTLTSIHDY